jgi:hypothetical protein
MPLTRASHERKLRDLMNSHAQHFADDGAAVRPMTFVASTRLGGLASECGREPLRGEFVI